MSHFFVISGHSLDTDGFVNDRGASRLSVCVQGGVIIAEDQGLGYTYPVTLTDAAELVKVGQAGNAAFVPCARDLARLRAALAKGVGGI